MQVAALILYIFSVLGVLGALLTRRRKKNLDAFFFIIPIIFILAQALYVLPLTIRAAAGINFDSLLSPHYSEFSGYIPFAALLTAIFNLTFSFFYVALPGKKELEVAGFQKIKKPVPLGAVVFLLAVSFLMVYQLASSFGGLINYILLGYKVTETFAGASQYAVAFDWMIVAAIVLLYTGYLKRDRTRILFSLALIIVLIGMFAIMGRRGVLVVLVAATVGGYHLLVKRLPLSLLFAAGLLFFLILSFIGLTRGESYEQVGQIQEIIAARSDSASDRGISIFYTLTDGNFAIPFETFPQIIKNLGNKFSIGFGEYSFRALLFLIPSALWDDRPLPLSNWYVELFYGEDQRNVGRQFFVLTAPYMDAGAVGVAAFGFVMAFLLRWVARLAHREKNDPLIIAGVMMFMANMLNLVSNDLLGFIIAFSKAVILPLIFMHACRKIRIRI